MRTLILAILAITFAGLTLSAMPLQAKSGDDAVQLLRIKTGIWPGFYLAQNVEELGEFLDASFINIGPDGSAVTRAEELASLSGAPWTPVNFRYVVDRMDWHGPDLVTVTGRGMSERANKDGTICLHSYASSNLLRRATGTKLGWKALSSHVSGVECKPEE